MRNIEKYKDNIKCHINICGLNNEFYKIKHGEYAKCFKNCDKCYDDCIRWLVEEYKEPVLDEVEKEYLSAVIRPFRKKVMDVVKVQYCEGKQRIRIRVSYGDCAELPFFKNNTMYKGMKVGKYYTPEELGL